MRPKITTSRHIARSIYYNEEKVRQQCAERLTGANLLKPLDRLTPEDMLRRFERRMEYNDRVSTSLHITLNFDPLDKLTNICMRDIAVRYMNDTGFARQPWMAWRHHDAGHPHCHIVATHVQWNGDPIDLYNIGQNQSEIARLRIEQEFHLVTKEKKQALREQELRMKDNEAPLRLNYGEKPLTRSLSDIVGYITEKYHYTNLQELNAVLKLYNVEAYVGNPGTKLYRDRGLLYRALDEHGRYIGRPLKASFFDSKPTLDNLEKKFAQNQTLKQELKEHIDCYARWLLRDGPDDWEKVRDQFRRENIALVINKDRSGDVRQVMFVDVRNKIAIAGEEIASFCNAQAIQQLVERDKARIINELKQAQTQRPRQRIRLHL